MTLFTLQNRYQAETLLGQGRLSTVYRARDLHTDQLVALKILQPHLRTQTSVVQRFRREMAAVQRLDHEAIVRIFDIIDTPEHLALVMEYAPGQDLKSWVRTHGPMPAERVIQIARPMIEAIEQAHSRGILHRDLSLINVILDDQNDDRIEIIGFGLARVDELVGLTMHTRVLGTLETMAPEAILGKPIDAQADLFSIGAMLYELVTARTLHDGRMASSLAFATRKNYLEDLQQNLENALQGQHEPLQHTILRALAPDPALRFATASQLLNALLGSYDQQVWHALENHTPQPCPQCKRNLIQGLNHCVYCQHTLSQLIEQPGRGSYFVQIISPYMTFKRDVWFETNTEAISLTTEQVRALHTLLLSYEDTRRLFLPGPRDAVPPYILFDSLTRQDAERIEKLLKERNIPCFIGDIQQTSPLAPPSLAMLQHSAELSTSTAEQSLKTPPLPDPRTNQRIANVTAAVFVLIALATIGIPLAENVAIPWLHTSMFFAASCAAFLSKPFIASTSEAYQSLSDLYASTLHSEEYTLPSFSQARIPGQRLWQLHHRVIDNVLPPGTTQTLLSLRDPALQQEFHAVLELTVRLFQRPDIPVLALREQLQPMLEHTGTILKRLALLQTPAATAAPRQGRSSASRNNQQQLTPPRNTAELFDAITRLDAQIADANDVYLTEPLIQQRVALYEEMASLDATIYETNLLKGHLLRVRATLLDLQAQFNHAQLPSLELVAEEITELKIRFDAEREVLELLENP